MKVVILAGGFGTRLSEETIKIPKPMVEIDEKPILVHIMQIYSHFGYNDFIICCGYKGYMIKSYFNEYYIHNSDITINLKNNKYTYHENHSENWKITLVDTGLYTNTSERIKKIQKYIRNERFMLTYGDAVGNINIDKLLQFHKSNNGIATVTAVKAPGRFGSLKITNNNVDSFEEKSPSLINGGFFVFEPIIFDYLDNDMLEKNVLPTLAEEGFLKAYKHDGFWHPMDTLHDKFVLEESCKNKIAPWKVW